MNELNVKVGDKVLLRRYYAYCNQDEEIVDVVKVTPTGRIKVSGLNVQFDKYGQKMGTEAFCSEFYQISSITKEQIIEFMERQRKNSIINKAVKICQKVSEKSLTYEQALKIISVFDDIS